MIEMTSRRLFITVLSIFIPILVMGCSIKPVPYDEFLYYEDEYYDEHYGAGSYPSHAEYDDYNYRAWHMSQYYRDSVPGYHAYGDANRKNNTNSSSGNYRSGEVPVRKAPEQNNQVGQMTRTNRVRQRTDDRNQRANSQPEIGQEQRNIARKHRREKHEVVRGKRKLQREKDDGLTEEELEEQRQKTLRKKKRR
jgi:hypothetical protein